MLAGVHTHSETEREKEETEIRRKEGHKRKKKSLASGLANQQADGQAPRRAVTWPTCQALLETDTDKHKFQPLST
jgi:hypothetical protein